MFRERSPRSTLSRRRLLQGAASLAASSWLPGCGYSANDHDTPPSTHPLPPAAGTVVQGSLVVTTNLSGNVPARFMGLSYEKAAMSYSYFHPSNLHLIALFRLLGNGVLRIGGGSVDQVLWTANSTGTHTQVTAADIKALAGFLEQSGWVCIYGINLATSTPALAAEEAAYAFSALGQNLLGIELGNEPDDYSTSGHYFVGDWNLQDFLARWDSFRAAILEAAPGVPLTGPATGNGNHITSWTLPFGESVTASEIKLLTQHYYRASGTSADATAAFLISPDTQLTGELALLHAGAQQLGIPYRISECNSFSSGGAPGVSDSYASSLWVIDFLFAVAMGGSTGINMHGGGNTAGYTPIADDSGGVIEVRPEYYGLLLFALAGPGALLTTQLSAGSVDATAYAIQPASGGLNLIVVNKDPLRALTLTIETNQDIASASLQVMAGPSLAATSGITIQGGTVNSEGGFAPAGPERLTSAGTQTTCSLPALSAGLITIT